VEGIGSRAKGRFPRESLHNRSSKCRKDWNWEKFSKAPVQTPFSEAGSDETPLSAKEEGLFSIVSFVVCHAWRELRSRAKQ